MVQMYLEAHRGEGTAEAGGEPPNELPSTAPRVSVLIERSRDGVKVRSFREGEVKVLVLDLDWDQVDSGDTAYALDMLRRVDQLPRAWSHRKRWLAELSGRLARHLAEQADGSYKILPLE